MLSGVQGGGLAVRGLWPGDGAHQQTDCRIQSFPVQRREPALHQRVSALVITLRKNLSPAFFVDFFLV